MFFMKEKDMMRRIFFLGTLMLLSMGQMYGEQTSRHIARIVKILPCGLPEEGTFVCSQIDVDCPLYVERRAGAISQIGIRLFTKEMRLALDDVVCNAVERLSLELVLCDNIEKQKNLLRENRISFVYNGFPYGTAQFSVLKDALYLMNDVNTILTLNSGSGKVILRAKRADDALVITMPADREFLFAYDKKEHEALLDEELNSWNIPFCPHAIPSINELQQLSDNIFVLPGVSYMIDSLKNETYYSVVDNQMRVLFHKDEPDRSLQNVLMGIVPMKNITLNVRRHRYERGKAYCKVSLENFLGYMQYCGMDFYSATYKNDNGNIQGVLLMHHPIYDYVHMLIVEDNEALYTGEDVVFQGDFYSFIPQHNIKTLFNF